MRPLDLQHGLIANFSGKQFVDGVGCSEVKYLVLKNST